MLSLVISMPTGLAAQALVQESGASDNSDTAGKTTITFKTIHRDLLADQKAFWIAPFRVRNTDDVFLRVATVGTGAALLLIDRRVGQELTDTPPGDLYTFGRKVEIYGGGVADYSVAGLFWLAGKAGGSDRARATGVLGVRAVTGAMLVVGGMKFISQRPRPTVPGSGGWIREHNADGEFFTGGRAFPSGHAAGAWAMGTVVAHQYSHKKWVPPVAYGLAGLVAVSRVAERAHFPSDIFIGSAIGFFIGRHVYRSQFDSAGDDGSVRRWRIAPAVAPGGGVAVRAEWVF